MDRRNIDKIAKSDEDRLLLAKLWDKITAGIRKSTPASTCFLSPRQLDMAKFLFGQPDGLFCFGGFEDAERKMLIYLPDYLDESYLYGEDAPVICLHATFYEKDVLSHRDFLGALIGCGIAREAIGDILVGKGFCDFFVTADVSSYILQNFDSAGRTKLHLSQITIDMLQLSEPETEQIIDTVATLRLDSVIAAGFRIGRTQATAHIHAGKVAMNGLACEKPDKVVEEGAVISVRGLGKIKLTSVKGQTKKGRTSIIIDRYV